MQTLYPIVRRVRRSLLAANAETLKTEILKAEEVEPACAEASADRLVQPVATKPGGRAALNEPAPASDENSATTRNDG